MEVSFLFAGVVCEKRHWCRYAREILEALESLDDLEALEALDELEEAEVWGGSVERSGRAGGLRSSRVSR